MMCSARAHISPVVPVVALLPLAHAVHVEVGVRLVLLPTWTARPRTRRQAMFAVVTLSEPGSAPLLLTSVPGVPSIAAVVPAPFEKCRAVMALASELAALVNVAVMVAPLA